MIDYDQPDEDPVIAEARRAREEYAARFGFNLEAIFEDLKQHAQSRNASGQELVSLPPRRPPGRTTEPAL